MSFLFGRRPEPTAAQTSGRHLHDDLVAAVRRPGFYLHFGVPDTFEGRFELLVLHAAVVLRRLNAEGARGAEVAQELVDVMFARFDVAMRELGVSDIGVPKRMKRLAQAFRGRTTAYMAALDRIDDAELVGAIDRNILGGQGRATDLARHIREVDRLLATGELAGSDGHLPALPEPLAA